MHHGQNRGNTKMYIKQKHQFHENEGKCIAFAEIGGIYTFCENRGNMQYASLT